MPADKADWDKRKAGWMKALVTKSFRGWPAKTTGGLRRIRAVSAERRGIALTGYDFTSQDNIRLRLYVAHRAGLKPDALKLVVLNSLDEQGWNDFLAMMRVGFEAELGAGDRKLPKADKQAFEQTRKMFQSFPWGMAYVCPRGIGLTEWNRNKRKRVQIRRRFMLLGQTRDGMRVYDVVRAAQALRDVEGFSKVPLWMQGEREMAGVTLYASLFTPNVKRLDLWHLNRSHRDGPIFLNVLRYLDIPAAVAMAAERSQVRLYEKQKGGWKYPRSVAEKLGWDAKQIQVRVIKPRSRSK